MWIGEYRPCALRLHANVGNCQRDGRIYCKFPECEWMQQRLAACSLALSDLNSDPPELVAPGNRKNNIGKLRILGLALLRKHLHYKGVPHKINLQYMRRVTTHRRANRGIVFKLMGRGCQSRQPLSIVAPRSSLAAVWSHSRASFVSRFSLAPSHYTSPYLNIPYPVAGSISQFSEPSKSAQETVRSVCLRRVVARVSNDGILFQCCRKDTRRPAIDLPQHELCKKRRKILRQLLRLYSEYTNLEFKLIQSLRAHRRVGEGGKGRWERWKGQREEGRWRGLEG